MRSISPLRCCLVMIAGGFTAGCDGDREGPAGKTRGGAEPAPLAVPMEADIGTEPEPPVIAIIRQAEADERIRREAREEVAARPRRWSPGSPPDPELQRLMTRQMDAKMKVDDHVARLKAYQGTPLEQKLAAEFVRRAGLWHQVRIQQILIGEAEEAGDQTKLAEATRTLALRLAEVKKSEEEWHAVEKGGWKKGG